MVRPNYKKAHAVELGFTVHMIVNILLETKYLIWAYGFTEYKTKAEI